MKSRVAAWKDKDDHGVTRWHVHAVNCPIPWIGTHCGPGGSDVRVLEVEDAGDVLVQIHRAWAEIDCIPGGERWKDYVFRVGGAGTAFAPCSGDLYDQKERIDAQWQRIGG